jgi:ABC-type Fe3+ transport system substrate-binding protein
MTHSRHDQLVRNRYDGASYERYGEGLRIAKPDCCWGLCSAPRVHVPRIPAVDRYCNNKQGSATMPHGRDLLAMSFAIALLFAGGEARAESLDDVYTKAKEEKALAFYSGGPAAPWEARAKEFQQRFPGIDVSVTGGFSNVLDRKIDEQLKAKKVEVDMALFQTLQDFVRWKKERVLQTFKPEGWDKIDKSFKDADGAWTAVQINAHPYAYNPNLVLPEDVPKSALDFLKPRFRGKVVAAYPADDDATLYDFYSVVQKYGWSYMDKYMANQPNFIQGHLSVARSIASGENLVTLDTIYSISLGIQKQGQPQGIAVSSIDPLPIWPYVAGIFQSAPHPNAAKLFLGWFLEKEQQSRSGTWSPRSDVPPPAGMKPIFAYKVVNNYRDFITNEPLIVDLRKRFETYTGPVKNVGGVR